MTLSAMSLYQTTGQNGLGSHHLHHHHLPPHHHQQQQQQRPQQQADLGRESVSPPHQTTPSVFASKGGVKLGFSIDSIVGNKRERSASPPGGDAQRSASPPRIKRSWSPASSLSPPPSSADPFRLQLTTGEVSSSPRLFHPQNARMSPPRARSRSPIQQQRRSRSPVSPPRASPPSPAVGSIYRPTPTAAAGTSLPPGSLPYLDQLASLKALYEAKGQQQAVGGLPLAPTHLLGPNFLPPGLGFPRPPGGLPHFLGLPGQSPHLPPREYPLHPWFINRHRFPLGMSSLYIFLSFVNTLIRISYGFPPCKM
jgi:hypothetical protein